MMWPPGHIIGYELTFTHTVLELLHALAEKRLPMPNFHDGVKNQRVLDAVERSATTGTWQTLEPRKVNQLQLENFDTKAELGQNAARAAAKIINQAIAERGAAYVIAATGASQFEFLDSLVVEQIDWAKVVFFH